MSIQIFCRKIDTLDNFIKAIPYNLETTFDSNFPKIIETEKETIDISEAVSGCTSSLCKVFNGMDQDRSNAKVTNMDGLMIGYSLEENKLYIETEEKFKEMGIMDIPEGEPFMIATRVPGIYIPFANNGPIPGERLIESNF